MPSASVGWRYDQGLRTGYAHLPLHSGRAPAWLFSRMVRLSSEVLGHIVAEYGSEEVLRRLSDPFWFQSFGCVLGFDWHSSGVTTTVCGALKEGIKGMEEELGFFIAGGKGTAAEKMKAMRDAGIHVVESPALIGEMTKKVLGRKALRKHIVISRQTRKRSSPKRKK